MIGTELGPYRIESQLGRGGMAAVYRAYHKPLQRYVALKVLDLLLSRNEEFLRRFEQEATIAARLDHPNIVAVYDLGLTGDYQYIAMRLIEGPSLERLIGETGALPTAQALELIAQIAEALDYAHQAGVLHRDVKPSNILLRTDGRPVLADFGIARAAEGLRLTVTQGVVGTPRYMSPEQALAKPLDSRSDVYSLAVVLFETLTGQPPFAAGSTPALLYKHVHEAPAPIAELRPDLPSAVQDLLDLGLAKSPDERFQTAAALARACRLLLRSNAIQATTVLEMPSPGHTMLAPNTPASPPPGRLADQLRPPVGPGQTPPATPQPAIPPTGGPRSVGRPLSSAPSSASTATPPGAAPPAFRPAAGAEAAGPTRLGQPAAAKAVGAAPAAPAAATQPSVVDRRRTGSRLPAWLGGLALVVVLAAGLALSGVVGPAAGGRVEPTPRPTSLVVAVNPTVAAATPAAAPTQAASVLLSQPTAPPTSAPTSPPTPSAPPTVTPVPEPVRRLAAGREALARQDFHAALLELKPALLLDPGLPGLVEATIVARLGVAEETWRIGLLKEAWGHFQAVLDQPLAPVASDQQRRSATLGRDFVEAELLWESELDTALGVFRRVYELDPTYRDVGDKLYSGHVIRAEQLLEQGETRAAAEHLVAAREIDPGRPEATSRLRALTPTPVPAPPPARSTAPRETQPEPQPQPQPQPTAEKQFTPPPPPTTPQ